jgi:hypothetical protein
LKEVEEKRQMDYEMEMALKMSMPFEEEKIEEELPQVGKLVDVPIIEYNDFKEKVTASVKKAVQSLMSSIRGGKLDMSLDTVLSFIKVALIG